MGFKSSDKGRGERRRKEGEERTKALTYMTAHGDGCRCDGQASSPGSIPRAASEHLEWLREPSSLAAGG